MHVIKRARVRGEAIYRCGPVPPLIPRRPPRTERGRGVEDPYASGHTTRRLTPAPSINVRHQCTPLDLGCKTTAAALAHSCYRSASACRRTACLALVSDICTPTARVPHTRTGAIISRLRPPPRRAPHRRRLARARPSRVRARRRGHTWRQGTGGRRPSSDPRGGRGAGGR